MKIEVENLQKRMQNITEHKFAGALYVCGRIEGKDIIAVECGVGKVNAAICTQILIDRFSPDVIINSGIAGSLSSKAGIADVVIAEDIVQHDMNVTALGDRLGEITFADEQRIEIPADEDTTEKLIKACERLENTKVIKGRIATGDIFVAGMKKRAKIFDRFGAVACEMEGGAVGQTCYRNGVPFAVLRCISDDFEEKNFMEYDRFSVIAAQKTITVLMEFIKSV